MAEHNHSHSGGNLKVAFFLNLTFTIIEIVGGFYTNSIAILSDALHDAGDSLSIGLAWYLQKVSKRGPTSSFTYGHQRFSVLGALITGTVLIVGMVVILVKAVPRVMNPEPVNTTGMIGLAVLGIAVNGFAAFRASKGSSLNEGIVSWHLLEDVLGWVAVLIGSVAMRIWDVPIVDPLLSIGISLFVLRHVAGHLMQAIKVFLQEAPEGFSADKVQKELESLPGVRSCHHVHSWSLDGEHHVLTAHLVMDADTTREQIVAVKKAVHEMVLDDGFNHLTIEVELDGESCSLTSTVGD